MAFSEEDGAKETPSPCLDWELLDRYFDGELSDEEDLQVQDHIIECDECYKKFTFRNRLNSIPQGVWEVAMETAVMNDEKRRRIIARQRAEAEAKQNQLSH